MINTIENVIGPRGQNTVWVDGVQKSILTRKEAAEFLGVTLVTLWKRTKKGMFNPIKLFGGTYYYQDDLMAPFRKGKVGLDKAPKRVSDNLKHLIEVLEHSGDYSLPKLKEALESQFEHSNEGLKLSRILELGSDEDNFWIERIKLVTDCMQTLANLINQVRSVVEVDDRESLNSN